LEQQFAVFLQVRFGIDLSVGSRWERNRKYNFDARPGYEILMQVQAALIRRLVNAREIANVACGAARCGSGLLSPELFAALAQATNFKVSDFNAQGLKLQRRLTRRYNLDFENLSEAVSYMEAQGDSDARCTKP